MSQASVSRCIGFCYCPVCKSKLPHYTRQPKREWKSRIVWCDQCKTTRMQFKNGDNGLEHSSEDQIY
jgi:hypothetical protein